MEHVKIESLKAGTSKIEQVRLLHDDGENLDITLDEPNESQDGS